jgi:hypothetical protein
VAGSRAQTQYRAVLLLDSDLIVRRSLDHVLQTMLARPEIAEARTPEGCLNPISVEPARGNYFNTGVWGVRPDASVFGSLVRFLRSGVSQCGIGIQTAAKGFFSSSRIDSERFESARDCCSQWRIAEARREAVEAAVTDGATPAAKRAAVRSATAAAERPRQRAAGKEERLRPWEILRLHAGYNMKANQGVVSCLRRQRQPINETHVVHWSGTRKPVGLMPASTIDQLERGAHAAYVDAWCSAAAAFEPGDLPVKQVAYCEHWRSTAEQRSKENALFPPLVEQWPWWRRALG